MKQFPDWKKCHQQQRAVTLEGSGEKVQINEQNLKRRGDRNLTGRQMDAKDEAYVSCFIISTVLFGRRRRMRKEECAIFLPTGFIFVRCRLVSQCNAPPITAHSVAPTPHPSRP